MKESYIRFMAPVIPQTSDSLFGIIDKKIKEKVERLHLMISSPGGSVFHGLSIYNFLKGSPIEIYTYNFGSVDSIGVVMFCAGTQRFSVPHARFLIHGVQLNFQGNHSFDEKGLEEKLKALRIDYQNIARVIADTVTKTASKVEKDMNNRTTLDPKQAVKYGLVHKIQSELFPVDADISVVNEPKQGAAMPIQIPRGLPIQMPAIQHMSKPEVESFTQLEDLDFGTYFY